MNASVKIRKGVPALIGTYDGNGVLDADVVFYAKQSPSLWLSDK